MPNDVLACLKDIAQSIKEFNEFLPIERNQRIIEKKN